MRGGRTAAQRRAGQGSGGPEAADISPGAASTGITHLQEQQPDTQLAQQSSIRSHQYSQHEVTSDLPCGCPGGCHGHSPALRPPRWWLQPRRPPRWLQPRRPPRRRRLPPRRRWLPPRRRRLPSWRPRLPRLRLSLPASAPRQSSAHHSCDGTPSIASIASIASIGESRSPSPAKG